MLTPAVAKAKFPAGNSRVHSNDFSRKSGGTSAVLLSVVPWYGTSYNMQRYMQDTKCGKGCQNSMHLGNHIKFENFMGYMGDKFGFTIDRRGNQRRIKWLESKRDPKELDCNELIHSLMDLRREDIGSRCYVTTRVDNELQSACWVLSEWKRDYEHFGNLTGIFMDCLANYTAYPMNLVIVGTRANNGQECTIFIGFFADETHTISCGFSFVSKAVAAWT